MKKILIAILFLVGAAMAQNTVAPTFFGGGWNNISPSGNPTQPNPWCPQDSNGAIASLTGFRMWDDGAKWGQIETSASTPTDTTGYTWTKFDWAMGSSVATKSGCNMDMLYQFGYVPDFASTGVPTGATACSTPTPAGCSPPKDINGDGTGADAWWLNYVGQVALRYSGKSGSKGHMKYWGTWNEADSANYWCWNNAVCGTPIGNPGLTGNSNVPSLNNLVLMAWDMYKLTKCIDPTSQVVSPDGHVGSMPKWFVNYSNTVITAPARSITITPNPSWGVTYAPITCSWGSQTVHGYQTFDIVDEHMRGTGGTAACPVNNCDPTAVIAGYNVAATVMNTTVPQLGSYPLWNDEWGWNGTTGACQIPNTASGAAYIAISLALMTSFHAPNVDREFFYFWDHACQNPPSKTIIGLANDVIAGWVTGSTIQPYSVNGSQVYTINGAFSSGGSFRIMFDNSKTCSGETLSTCGTANVSAGGFTKYTTLDGVQHSVPGSGLFPLGYPPVLLSASGNPAANAPTCSPGSGTYSSLQTVTCSTTSPGAIICGNLTGNPATNGTTGCAPGSTITGGASVNGNSTLYVVAGGTGYTDSTINSYTYVFQGSTPTFSPVAGSYGSTQSVTLSQSQSLAMCYTTDNSTPTSNGSGACAHGTLYSSPISVATSETLKAVGINSGWNDSNVGTASYIIGGGTGAAAPVCSPAGGTFASNQNPTCSTTSVGAVMCYNFTGAPATNGTTGCTTGTLYSGAISVTTNSTLYIVAGGTGYADSLVTSYAFVFHGSQPTFSPVGGTYVGAQTVTLTDVQSLAMCYTTDGSTPTSNGTGSCLNGTHYISPVTLLSTTTLQAIGYKNGWTDSGVGIATYTISGGFPASNPVNSPPAGTYNAAQTVSITSSSPGAIICYTLTKVTPPTLGTNGTTGCVNGTLYTGPLSIGIATFMQAVAGGSGYTDSSVVESDYFFQPANPPTFSPVAGTYNGAQTITLSNLGSYVMCYTTDGSDPLSLGDGTCSPDDFTYSVPFVVASSETVKAIAINFAWTDSNISSAAYVINYTLTVSPAGLGTVSSSPIGINLCSSTGGVCNGLFAQGSAVVLTATAGSGYAFAGWSGGGCSGTSPCTVSLNSNTTVTATFSALPPSPNGKAVGVMLN